MKISVVGLGYVGLSLATLLSKDNEVFAIDINKDKLDKISKNISPIQDKEFVNYFNDKKVNINTKNDKNFAYNNSDLVIICVPTNYINEKKKFDTSIVENTIFEINSINKNVPILLKSTVNVNYTKQISKKVSNPIVFSPEFLRETKAIYDNLNPSRIIIGATKKSSAYIKVINLVSNLLNSIKENDAETLVMDSSEAESVKLFSNTYLALRVAFFNELDTFAESKKLNTRAIIDGVCLDPRISDLYNNPSFGYGGYCLPKDTKELKSNYKNAPQEIISTIIKSNEKRKNYIVKQILKKIDYKNNKNKIVGIYGLSMKSNSDNIRESSVLDVAIKLINLGVNVIIYEPNIAIPKELNLNSIKNLDEFKEKSDIIISNRMDKNLDDVYDKVYSRDIYSRD